MPEAPDIPMTLRKHIRKVAKDLLYRPWGLTMGADSYIKRPHSIAGRTRITIGCRTVIMQNALINTVANWAGVSFDPVIAIGDDVYIGRYVFMNAANSVEIGSGSVLSDHVYVNDALHGVDPNGGPIMEQALSSKGPIKIGRNCFLGYRTSVMPGVTLGEHCVVGINSVVTKSFPGFSMLVGSPARLIKVYSHVTGLWESVADRCTKMGDLRGGD
jgi:acetyltransferase-like isoleucine patch superfamily enzyme